MNSGQEKRRYPRYSLPVLIEAPELSDYPLVPEDISLGGFMVVVSSEPETEAAITCTIQVYEEVFENCKGRVAWIRENKEDPPTWAVGLEFNLPDEVREHFDGVLKSVLAEMDTES